MRDKIEILLFLILTEVIVFISAVASFHLWPLCKLSVSDVIILFEVIVVLIATINIGVFELNKREIAAKTKEIDDKANEMIKEINIRIIQTINEEQIVSRATTHFASARLYWTFYLLHAENKIESKKLDFNGMNITKEEQSKKVDKSFKEAKKYYVSYLNAAIDVAKHSVTEVEQLDRLKHEKLICKCKNNLAFFLAVRGDEADAENARDLSSYIYQVAKTSEEPEILATSYISKATRALVLQTFDKEDKASREKAYWITNALLNNDDEKMPLPEKERLKKTWTFIENGKPFEQILEELKVDLN